MTSFPMPRARRSRRLLAALIATLVVAPSGSATAEPSADASFEASFDPFDHPPREFVPAAHAVDVTGIEPPLEPEDPRVTQSLGSGTASYYGRRFHGRRTANGERFDMAQLTAAHRTLPFGSLVQVTNPSNGRSVVVRINDRGPFHGGRVIDVSRAAAEQLGLIQRGHGRVELALVEG